MPAPGRRTADRAEYERYLGATPQAESIMDNHRMDPERPLDPDIDPAIDNRARRGRPRHAQPDILAAIAVGGVIGATARYGLEQAIPTPSSGFPVATFVINLVGSLLLGFVIVISLERLAPTRYVRPFLATGIIGSFTTFSTFAVENVELVHDGAILVAALYVPVTLVGGITASWVGIVAARLFTGPHHETT